MSVFNSLGSNYNLKFVLKTLLSNNKEDHQKKLKSFLERKYNGAAVLLYKGREAIELTLKTLNLPKDSFVAINGFTCFAVYEAIKKANLNVEYLDIEKGELNFSPQELEEHLKQNPQIKVVIVQNTLGYPCQIEQIAKICKDKKIILIEDLAHSVGTRYENGEESGSAGNLVVLSFSQDKIIDAVSGGALINRGGNILDPKVHPGGVHLKKQVIDRFYPLFTYLIRNTYSFGIGKVFHFILKNLKLLSEPMDYSDQIHLLPGWYCNLVNLAFDNLEGNLAHRKKIASLYATKINPKIISNKITNLIPFSANLRFPIFVNNRAGLIKYLKEHGIYISDIWYDAPIAPKKYIQLTNYQNQCPNSELASSAILNLPTHQNVSENDAERISQLINQWLKLQ